MNLDRWITRSTSRARAQVSCPHILLLRSRPQSVSDARHFIRGYLATNVPDASDDHLDQVSLVASELVTNAVKHGSAPGDPLRLVIDADDRCTRIEVHDSIRRHPRIKAATDNDTSGRGLSIVNTVCAGLWGANDTSTGKSVWAEVHAL
ncbi:ATP-binding protein [Streptomyces kunmingensis]|uniref:ATP-binding protein n=2 Tax=Streptomyces kunmingensis TaxID=68225 RepID=A0ABU6CJH0_9ACTN|nr:ATP-binding protein [Streptomyces kunmingensis]MEB3964871.1 ATP-binding protein [Streptomyces kunmingensis]